MKKQGNYQIIARKYRPQTFHAVVGQDPIVTTLKNGLISQRIPHAYLFCGSRGTGKTTLARLMAKALNCSARTADNEPCNTCQSCIEITSGNSLNVIEIDGASHRGIDDMRQINETISFAPKGDTYKIYIIDEVHMLTREAFNALLKTLEEPPSNVKFFFATTEPHKILPTIISRCQRFDLKRIPLDALTGKLSSIASELSVDIAEDALKLIATCAEGGLRDAESLLDQVLCACPSPISEEDVRSLLGMLPYELLFELDQAVHAEDLLFAYNLSKRVFEEGKDINHFLEALLHHFHALLLKQIAPKHAAQQCSEKERELIKHGALLYTQEQLFFLVDLVADTIGQLSKFTFKQIHLNMLLLKILRSKTVTTIGNLSKRLLALQEGAKLPTETPPPPPEPKIEPKPEPKPAAPKTGEGLKKKSHYDTLVRFAAVELEATVKQ